MRKECEKDLILIICENKNDKKSYIGEFNSESRNILFEKSLDETFHLFGEWINGNNTSIKEKVDRTIIKIYDSNKNVLIKLYLKQNNSNDSMGNKKMSYSLFSDTMSSIIKKSTELRDNTDISGFNLSIPIFIPNNRNLNNSCLNEFNLLFNSIQLKIDKGKELSELNGLLNLCLLKKISTDLIKENNMNNLLKSDLINILTQINENIHLTGYSSQSLETMIKEKKAFNILSYSNYLKNFDIFVLDKYIIRYLLNLTCDKKTENENYWYSLSLLLEHNEHFEKTFIKDLKNCYFDYSLVSINCVISDNLEECQNRKFDKAKKKILYHYSDINPISKIFYNNLEISNKSQDEANFYDNFECFAFNFLQKKERRKIIPTNSTFSFIVSEIFFQVDSILDINENSNQSNLSNENTFLNRNDIHLVNFEDENLKQKNKSLGYSYTIKEKSQVLPLFTVTLKRNEYFVLHRDPNFNEENKHNQFLRNIQNQNQNIFDINIYYESSTEKALEFLLKRKYNKVVLITNVGQNLEGKRFVDIVRKIYGFEVLALFFSHNKNHLEWIKNYKNSLFTDNINYYREFITNFNDKGLKALKEKLEKELSIQFKFNFDYIIFNNYIEKGPFSHLHFKCDYFRRGYLKNGNNYLYMNKEGNVSIKPEKSKWVITLLGNEITLFSNGFYLDNIKGTEKVKGNKQMVIWGLATKDKDKFYFFSKNKDNINDGILSIEKEENKVNKIFPGGENETFIFNDTIEDGLKDISSLTQNVESVVESIEVNENLSL